MAYPRILASIVSNSSIAKEIQGWTAWFNKCQDLHQIIIKKKMQLTDCNCDQPYSAALSVKIIVLIIDKQFILLAETINPNYSAQL
jgi:hypothetical protein